MKNKENVGFSISGKESVSELITKIELIEKDLIYPSLLTIKLIFAEIISKFYDPYKYIEFCFELEKIDPSYSKILLNQKPDYAKTLPVRLNFIGMPDIYNKIGYSIERGSTGYYFLNTPQGERIGLGHKGRLDKIKEYENNPLKYKSNWDPYVQFNIDQEQCEEIVRLSKSEEFTISWYGYNNKGGSADIWKETINGKGRFNYYEMQLIDEDDIFGDGFSGISELLANPPFFFLTIPFRLLIAIINFFYKLIMKRILKYSCVPKIPNISMLKNVNNMYYYTTKKILNNSDKLGEGLPFNGFAIERSISGQIKNVYKFKEGKLIKEVEFNWNGRIKKKTNK